MLDVHHDGDGGTVDVSIQDSDIQTFLKENRPNKTILEVSYLFVEIYSRRKTQASSLAFVSQQECLLLSPQ